MMRTPGSFRPGRWRGTLPPDMEAGVIGLSFTDEHGYTHRYALPLRDAWLLRQSLQAVPAVPVAESEVRDVA